MPRIDPLALLNCLSVLLGPSGGIKGTKEVDRLVTLMTKFSKKLVSKCIYIQILKTTSTDLLNQFMSTGGWDLIHIWLTDAILAKNWALIQELLELLLLCPVDIARLKSNNNPKLIKGLSKEGSHQGVRILACRLVEQWLKIVKDSVPVPSDQSNQSTMPPNHIILLQNKQQTSVLPTENEEIKVKTETDKQREPSTVKVQDLALNNSSCVTTFDLNPQQQQQQQQQLHDKIHIQPVQLQIVNKTLPGQTQPTQIKKQSFVVVSSNTTSQHQPSVPVYKITIRDGKQVLTKVETDASNITNIFNDNNGKLHDNTDNNVSVDDNDKILIKSECENNSIVECRTLIDNDDDNNDTNSEVNHISISFKDDNVETKDIINDEKNAISDNSNNKLNDKENHDSHKKDDKIILTDNKKNHHSSSSSSKSSNSKYTTSSSSSSSRSSSHKSSSHRSNSSNSSKSSTSSYSKSSKDKDRHHSSKSRSSSSSSSSKGKSDKEKEREREKEKLKKDQAEKDKATLEKVQGQSLSTKFGKIPKRKADDEKSGDNSLQRKSSTEIRDNSKENKDKSDPRKSPSTTQSVLEKKNISISIENRKNSLDTSRPKTVKTFNSKFRSTGLEEEIKPPPPRSAGGKKPASSTNDNNKKIPPTKLTLKRTSPIKESGVLDKRAKLSLDTPVTPPGDDKKGAIKLIPPKPKPMVLQESDMFMDALTASTKSKEPRKRKRRSSLSKDGTSDSKKTDVNALLGETTMRDTTSPPVSSPPDHNSEEKTSFPIKPEFKFYQDTLETDEDKEDKKKASPQEEDEPIERKEKETRESFEDDEGSRTPTCDEEVDEMKPPASPDDSEDNPKDPASPNPEIRYVDGLRSVLLLQKRKGPKKSLKWKGELESIRYFELDETERVNVTKTFTDMKQMEKQNEREAFQMARKLSTEDTMEERTRWKSLIPIDLPPALVDPGKDSKEKEIQYAREKGILQALYFNRSMIPDSASEPDEERHHVMTDPKVIPLEDLTGNKESEKDFTLLPWPEPKPPLIQTAQPQPSIYQTAITHNPGALANLGPGIQPIMGGSGITQQMASNIMPNHMLSGGDMGAGGWRTGDGKVVVPDIDMNNMNNIPNLTGFPPPNMIHPPGIFNHQQQGQPQPQQDGFIVPGMMGMEEGPFVGHMPNNFPTPGIFGPGPNLQGPPPPRGGMHGNRMRGGPGWFRGGMGPVRGGWSMRGNWRGSGKQPPVCRQFTKNGFCRIGDKCQYLHPGVNCPPF